MSQASPAAFTAAVRKRDGVTVQAWDWSKVETAIRKAAGDVGREVPPDAIVKAINLVFTSVFPADIEVDAAPTVDVERIQDAVEVALMRHGLFDVAKAYILYRQKRTEARTARKAPDRRAAADYIHASKYARWSEALSRREVYAETVARVEDMHLRRFAPRFAADPVLESDIRCAFDAVQAKKVLPSMRSMQFGGAAVEAINTRCYNCAATLIDRPRAFAEALYLLLGGTGVGYSVQFAHVAKLPPLVAEIDRKNVVHHVVGDTIEGWANALDALMNSYFVGGTLAGSHVEFAYHQIRDAGTVLKTSGGRAPGHLQLKVALERIRAALDGARGRRLRPIECHRILCHAADAVLSGGIRRSAMICLFSIDDGELMHCKAYRDWYDREPWLANANNSVVLKRGDVTEAQYRRIFEATRHYGEPGFVFVDSYDHPCNPCQPGWATVLTPEGIRTFDDIDVGSTIWSGKQWTKVVNKVATGVKPVFEYHTRAGVFIGTENHRVISNGVRVEAKDAESVDRALGSAEGGGAFDPQVVMDGLVLGDGTVHKASNHAVWLLVGEHDGDYRASEVGSLMVRRRERAHRCAWEVTTTVTADELPKTYNRAIPARFRQGDERTVRSFLRGLYSANGSVVGGRVTLKASSLTVTLQAQEMLSSIGIASYYTVNRSHDMEFGNGTYTCRQSYDLNITSDRGRFATLIGFIQHDKCVRLAKVCRIETGRKPPKTAFDIVDVAPLGEHPVYDITVEADEHTYWTGGLLVSNCGEIHFNVKYGGETGWGMCNLTEMNAALFDSPQTFFDATWAAAFIGTLQSSYTTFPYLGAVTEKIVRRDALLGVSMTGMQHAPAIALDPGLQREAAELAVSVNRSTARRIGINNAARVTCVKPAGTTTLELDLDCSGIGRAHARRFIRRVTADELEVPFQAFKAVNPHMCVRKPDGKWVIEFPREVSEGTRLKEDQSAVAFLADVLSAQRSWVIPGTAREQEGLHHNVSNTIQVRPHEWDEIADAIWRHRDELTGVSLLPDDGDQIFAFAPFEAVKTPEQEARWNELVAKYKPVDYENVMETEDGTALSGEAACAGGKCDVVYGR